MSKLYSALSLCKKAGALVNGFDAAKAAINANDADVVLLCSDLSEKTVQRICKTGSVRTVYLKETMKEISPLFAKPTGILVIKGKDFAKLILKTIEEQGYDN